MSSAWTKNPGAGSLLPGSRRYVLDSHLCDRMHLYEAPLLSWRPWTCRDLHAFVRAGFDQWQLNAAQSAQVVFWQTTSNDEAADSAILVRAYSFGSSSSSIARAHRGTTPPLLEFNSDKCWFADRIFCSWVHEHQVIVFFAAAVVWCVSLFSLLALACAASPRERRHHRTTLFPILRLALWSTVIAVPWIFFAVLLPCLECFDVVLTTAHEVGHLLGLGHPDDTTHAVYQGCGAAAIPVNATEVVVDAGVMHSTFQHRPTACLSQGDADGVRTLFAPSACGDEVVCYDHASAAGLTKASMALVWSFVFAWCVVALRWCLEAHWKQRRRGVRPSS